MNVSDDGNCTKCGGKSFFVMDTSYNSEENHCLNEKCGFYIVDSGSMKIDIPEGTFFDGSGYRNTEELLEFKEMNEMN